LYWILTGPSFAVQGAGESYKPNRERNVQGTNKQAIVDGTFSMTLYIGMYPYITE
jgi:hypothetical protein